MNRRWIAILLTIALGCVVGAAGSAALIHVIGSERLLAVTGSKLPWYTTRAAAITAYLMLSATTLLGLTITAKGPNRPFTRATVFVLHEYLSWLAWGFVGLHVAALLVDTFQPFSLTDVLVPLASSYRRVGVGLGVISLYLLAVLVTSFYVRTRIGQRTWRAIHFSSFLLFVLATLHGITAGSSTTQPWMRAIYLLCAGSVLALLGYRIAKSRGALTRSGGPHPALSRPDGRGSIGSGTGAPA